jgi:two-component system CheB/CheR fusion protein
MNDRPTFIVGIGASAGGIPALEEFFHNLPSETGMAFVIVTHLSPDRKTLLDQVLANYTALPVKLTENGEMVVSDTVYVMPENAVLTIAAGRFVLGHSDLLHRERKPIDVFLASLAQDQGDRAIGIILSGGDSDGTLGAKAIRLAGGVTMAQVQDGTGPKNPEMPLSAISSGVVDFALPAHDMPTKLMQLVDQDAIGRRKPAFGKNENTDEDTQENISRILLNETGHDFSGYKSRTFLRRVARRMQVVQTTTAKAYIERLHDDPNEVKELFRDLLINVTNFFRDTDTFAALKADVIPQLFLDKGSNDTIRIWVPGCATGEEAFSLAMLMREELDGRRIRPRVQIFATDIDDAALTTARAARYPEALLQGMTDDRRERFFRKDGSSFVVAKDVREMCFFSAHSLISDPPFSRMDLISCRNLLIYFSGALQAQVIPTFHYALRPGGYLLLGSSEGISNHTDLFTPVDKKHRLFKVNDVGPRRFPLEVIDGSKLRLTDLATKHRRMDVSRLKLTERVEAQIVDRHAPPHLAVTVDGEIVHYSSQVTQFLEVPRGAPNRMLMEMVRRDLRADLRSALRQAVETHMPVTVQTTVTEADGAAAEKMSIKVEPVVPQDDLQLFLVIFQRAGEQQSAPTGEPIVRPTNSDVGAEQDIRELRERLQTTIEEYETALEELKASNEELVSVNEEAQSTNEELEASKEEMQSLNEELSTINAELTSNVEELDRSHTDLKNLYAATRIATIFLDRNLIIRNFTPEASTLFRLRTVDIGRPLSDLATSLDYPEMQAHIAAVFDSGDIQEHRLPPQGTGAHFLVRLVPYRDRDEAISGVVITFVDISNLMQAEAQQRVLMAELNHRVKNMLALVVSIARNSIREGLSPAEFADTLVSRLQGLARAHSLLARAMWNDVSLEDILRLEDEAHGPGRILFSGPRVTLKPDQALPISMVVHELATNAAKHGSLSVKKGLVSVEWSLADQQVTLIWSERDGPKVEKPERDGFGLVLIEGQITHQLDGTMDVTFNENGFAIRVQFPLKE